MNRIFLLVFSCLCGFLFTQCTQINFDKAMAMADAHSRYSEYEFFSVTTTPLSPNTTVRTICNDSTVSPNRKCWLVCVELNPYINTIQRDILYIFYDVRNGKYTETPLKGTLKEEDGIEIDVNFKGR